ncbi:MAG: hydantoinase/oxoprolinase family protein [Desulfovibrio sp.]|nr:hydantoinase/oxoprolinase family protein [Desulfovibrio sp.]
MDRRVLLGIDCGGTHTDGALIVEEGGALSVRFAAKVPTDHDDLPSSITALLSALAEDGEARSLFSSVDAVTLGTTLAINALVQGKAEKVALLLSAGPGLSPKRFALGDHVSVVPGGLDHRGVEVEPLDMGSLPPVLSAWKHEGIREACAVSKFSPRNPSHENAMGAVLAKEGFRTTLGHTLSGELNYPRRIATAYFNAAVERVHNAFLGAVEDALSRFDIHASVRLLKADGGSVPLDMSRKEPVQSILSGPAASVMGILALCPEVDEGTTLLLDVGGTTTDISLILDGSPVVDRFGMQLNGRRTLVRSLASLSIGVGGDSHLTVSPDGSVVTGPERNGFAMAFGGETPTLLDALNVLLENSPVDSGDRTSSKKGIASLAMSHNLPPDDLARKALDSALQQIGNAASSLLDTVNRHPVYTLKALRTKEEIRPKRIVLVGGPCHMLEAFLSSSMKLPVIIPPLSHVANAVGAALTKPTASFQTYADTGKGMLFCPSLDREEPLKRGADLDSVTKRTMTLFSEHLTANGIPDAEVEVLSADLFATLDDYGGSSRDMRVHCQVVPGIYGRPHADCTL